ncbi:MAG: 2-amino-4-hydroxy-6-hydroxymethyldihydropteridine diphosphokinase [Anaerolineales bacterium]|nr:2-amino-4-hydroxy-6-hydroxymethyldihydropteridine diphosphokinase [Anaerolineales bacterium]
MILLGLGTNLGDRVQNLQQAIDALAASMKVTAVSPIYETPPWGVTDQPSFYNICLAVETDKTPKQLLSFIKNLEIELGREPTYRWGPRLIDIDLLFFGSRVIDEDALQVPHPRMQDRAFVLAPLAAIASEFVHPQTGQSVQAMLAMTDQRGIRPLTDVSLRTPTQCG